MSKFTTRASTYVVQVRFLAPGELSQPPLSRPTAHPALSSGPPCPFLALLPASGSALPCIDKAVPVFLMRRYPNLSPTL